MLVLGKLQGPLFLFVLSYEFPKLAHFVEL